MEKVTRKMGAVRGEKRAAERWKRAVTTENSALFFRGMEKKICRTPSSAGEAKRGEREGTKICRKFLSGCDSILVAPGRDAW